MDDPTTTRAETTTSTPAPTRSARPHGGRSGGDRSGLGLLDAATLAGVLAVVVLVSLPRLRVLARTENRGDALRVVRELDGHWLSEGASLGELVSAEVSLQRLFSDPRPLEDGRRVRCHGYLFELVDGDLVAWPVDAGRTGSTVYARTSDGRVFAHPNGDGRWEGAVRAPAPPWQGEGWRELPPVR
jgi:hypothetical protein